MTIRQRLETLIYYRIKRNITSDVWINVFDNTVEYSSKDIGFWLSDYNEHMNNDVMNYLLDNEKRTTVKWNFGFNGLKE